MKTKILALLILVLAFSSPAAIIFFTDKPNSTPFDSDFFALQRNRDYVNSSVGQMKTWFWTSPSFTGNGSISGTWNVGGSANIGGSLNVGGAVINGTIYYGDGSGLSNVSSQVYLKNKNDNGTNETFWGTTGFDVIQANLAYFTNLFTFKTNAQYLATDGNGKVIAGTGLPATNVLINAGANIVFTTNLDGTIVVASSGTNVVNTFTNNTFVNTNIFISTSNAFFNNTYTTNAYFTNVYAYTNFSTNLYFVSGKGNTLIITNYLSIQAGGGGLTNKTLTPLSAMASDANDAEVSIANAHGVLTNSAAGPPTFGLLQNTELQNSTITIQGSAVALGGSTLAAGSSPFFNLVNSTNLIYRYTTNAMTGITLTFGQAFFTNISTANITVTAINAQDLAAYETCVMWCTNASGTSWTVTLPNGIGSPGLGLPPVITVTNKQSCQIYIEHYGNQATNAWFKAIY